MNIPYSIGNAMINIFVIISFIGQMATGFFLNPKHTPTAVQISISKTADLVNDLNGDSKLNIGEELEYSITIKNKSIEDALDVQLEDILDTNLVWNGDFSSTPLSFDQNVETNEDTTKSINLTAKDLDGDILIFEITTVAEHGNLGELTSTGDQSVSVVYTPDENFYGADSFQFRVLDEENQASNLAVVTINVVSINDKPVADDLTESTNEDTPLLVALSGSDTENTSLNYFVVNSPTHGSLSGTAPNLTYTPTLNYFGSDSFTYKSNDSELDSELALVSITINAVNDAPTANNQSLTTNEDTTKDITLSGGDAENDPITFQVVDNPTQGSLTGTVPNLTYTPDTSYSGLDSFTFKTNDGLLDSELATISLTINAVNDAPTANDDSYSTYGNTPLFVDMSPTSFLYAHSTTNLLENDSDPVEGTEVFITGIDTTGTSGSVLNWQTYGSFIYYPAVGFSGEDSFTYELCDSGTPLPSACSTATVTITVGTPIWFVNSAADPGGDGSVGNPFQSLAPLNNDGSDIDDPGDIIYLLNNGTDYEGDFHLETNQQLIGSGAALVIGENTLRAAGTPPTIKSTTGNGVYLANGVSVKGIKFDEILQNAIVGNNFTGTVQHSNLIFGAVVQGYDFYFSGGTPQLTVDQEITNFVGGLLKVQNVGSGASFVFNQAISTTEGIECVNAPAITLDFNAETRLGITIPAHLAPGLKLENCHGNIDFTDLMIRSQNYSGLDIQNSSNVNITTGTVFTTNAANYGMRITDSSFTGTFRDVTIHSTTSTDMENLGLNDIPTNDGNGDGIFLKNNTGSLTITSGTIQGNADDGIDVRNSSNLQFSNMMISSNGTNGRSKVSGIKLINLSGTTNSFNSCTFGYYNTLNSAAISLINTSTSADLAVNDAQIIDAPTSGRGISAVTYDTGQIDLMIDGTGDREFIGLYGPAVMMETNGTQNSSLTVTNQDIQSVSTSAISARAYESTTLGVTLQGNTILNTAYDTGTSSIEISGSDGSTINALLTNNQVTSSSFQALGVFFNQISPALASTLTLQSNTWGTSSGPIGTNSNGNGLEIQINNSARVNFSQSSDSVYMVGNTAPLYGEEIQLNGTAQATIDLDNNQFTQQHSSGFTAWGLTAYDTSQVCADLSGNVFEQVNNSYDYDIYNAGTAVLNIVNYPILSTNNTGDVYTTGSITNVGSCSAIVPDLNPTQTTFTQMDAAIGTLPAGAQLEIKFRVHLAEEVSYTVETVNNQASLSGSNFDAVQSDDPALPGTTDMTRFPIELPQEADLVVSQTIFNEADPAVGDPLRWVVTVSSQGPAPMPTTTLTAAFTSGLTWQTYPSACVLEENAFICTQADLQKGEEVEYVFETEINPGVQPYNTFTSTVTGLELPDPILTNNMVRDGLKVDAWVVIPTGPATDLLPVTKAPSGAEFLGKFGKEVVGLEFSDLPLHTQVEISFDVVIIGSWDGTGDNYSAPNDEGQPDQKTAFAPDRWGVGVNNGQNLIETTFANWPSKYQSYPAWFEQGLYPPKTGAEAINTLGYSDVRGGDATYHFSYLLKNGKENLDLNFFANGLEDIDNESWGLMNLQFRVINMGEQLEIYLPVIVR